MAEISKAQDAIVGLTVPDVDDSFLAPRVGAGSP
jgi:hypothetical protein